MSIEIRDAAHARGGGGRGRPRAGCDRLHLHRRATVASAGPLPAVQRHAGRPCPQVERGRRRHDVPQALAQDQWARLGQRGAARVVPACDEHVDPYRGATAASPRWPATTTARSSTAPTTSSCIRAAPSTSPIRSTDAWSTTACRANASSTSAACIACGPTAASSRCWPTISASRTACASPPTRVRSSSTTPSASTSAASTFAPTARSPAATNGHARWAKATADRMA